MSDVCGSCPHAVVDHLATGCMTCSCPMVFEAADPEPAPEPEGPGTVVPETEPETGTVVPEPSTVESTDVAPAE